MKRFPPLLLVVALLGCGSQPEPATPDANDTANNAPAADAPTVVNEIPQTTDDTAVVVEAEDVGATQAGETPESHSHAFADLPGMVRELLERKESTFPYYAEYQLAFPPSPTPLGRNFGLRFFSVSPDMLYSEEESELYSSRLLLRDGTAIWEYEDPDAGSYWFTGPAPLAVATPQEFLEQHDFACNLSSYIDDGILSLLAEGQQLRKHESSSGRDVIMTETPLGRLEVMIGESDLQIGKPGRRAEVLLSFTFGTGEPEWANERVTSLLQRFDEAGEGTIISVQSPEEFNFGQLLKRSSEEGRSQPIPHVRLQQTAWEYGYYLPTVGTITSAKGDLVTRPNRGLTIVLQHRSNEYEILQMIPGFRAEDIERLPAGFVREERRIGAYDVFHIHDPGTEADFVYFVGDKVSFIINGDRFRDETLDEVINSFQRPAETEMKEDDMR